MDNMKINLLIATVDKEYANFISDNISEKHSNKIEVFECIGIEGYKGSVSKRKFDVALVDSSLVKSVDMSMINLPILLQTDYESSDISIENIAGLGLMRKHQRISSIVDEVLERYSRISGSGSKTDSKRANITAVWSPAGGVGKTTVALAYAASYASEGKEVFYLNLEDFSGVPYYFKKTGKSISSVFEMLDTGTGNIKMLIQGICCTESGITYLCSADNFEDMYILSDDNISDLIGSCAMLADELILDLPCTYDARTKKSFEIAGKIFIVTAPGGSADTKLMQFKTQNNIYEGIKEKTILVANKGSNVNDSFAASTLSMPLINFAGDADIYKILSETGFRS